MTRDELYTQSLTDLLRAAIVLAEILENKQLTKVEENRIAYGTKLIDNVKERQLKLNSK
ncbi:MAG: hypothetical protein V4560_14800 [Bacteroidota bacterium]